MEQILLLMQERNHHLERFYDTNVEQLEKMGRGDFEDVEAFYISREHILNKIRHIDQVLEREQAAAQNEVVSGADKILLRDLIDSKNELVKQILAQDLQVMALVEKQKSHIIRELSGTSRHRRAMSSYKMGGGGVIES